MSVRNSAVSWNGDRSRILESVAVPLIGVSIVGLLCGGCHVGIVALTGMAVVVSFLEVSICVDAFAGCLCGGCQIGIVPSSTAVGVDEAITLEVDIAVVAADVTLPELKEAGYLCGGCQIGTVFGMRIEGVARVSADFRPLSVGLNAVQEVLRFDVRLGLEI